MSDLIDQDKNWNISILRENLQPASAIEILKTPISWSSPSDKVIWHLANDGVYSVKTGYKALINTTIPSTKPSSSSSFPTDIWKFIWSSNVPSKLKHFMWKTSHYFIPTKEALFKKRISTNPLCPICKEKPESIEHLFLLCPWTFPLWFGLQFILPPSRNGLTNFHTWFLNMCERLLSDDGDAISKLIFSL